MRPRFDKFILCLWSRVPYIRRLPALWAWLSDFSFCVSGLGSRNSLIRWFSGLRPWVPLFGYALRFPQSHSFETGTFLEQLLFQKSNFLEEADFSEKQYSAATTFFGRATSSEQLFLRYTFSEQEPFHSYTCFPDLHFLFISY